MSTGISLRAEGIRKAFRTGFSLEVPELDVPAGSTLALLGPSGSGKSTLMSIAGLLETPDAGRLVLDGRTVTAADREARMLMAAVFQRPYLFRGNVADNVAYGLALRKVPAPERRSRVEAALARVGLADFAGRSAGTLSGGEAQRVALARALVLEPRLLLMDEPLASLDPLLKRRLVSDFATILRSEGVTVVYVTHDHDEARVVADRIAVMNAGRIVAQGPAADVMSLPADEWTAEFLGLELPAPGVVVSSEDGLMEIRSGTTTHVVAAGTLPVGSSVVFSIPAEDVLLAVADSEIGQLSARNRLRGIVDSVEPRGATWRVVVKLDGASVASNVSHAALREMALAEGDAVQVIFKATAVRVAAR